MRSLLFALLLSWAGAASAQPTSCVNATAAWTTPYLQGTIQAITYYVWNQVASTAWPLLAVLYRTGEFHLHVNVPLSIAQPFTFALSADQRYNSVIKKTYKQALLAEDS